MELREFVGALARRWYLTLVAVAACLLAGTAVFRVVAPSYTAEGTTVLLPPMTQVVGLSPKGAANPLLYLSDLTQTRDVLIQRLGSDTVRNAVSQPGMTYTVSPDVNSSGPVIVVSAQAPSPDAAKAAVEGIQRMVPQLLSGLQADLGIDTRSRIESFALTQDQQAVLSHKPQIRLAVLAVVAVAGICFLGIGLLDGVLLVRRRRSGEQTEEGDDADGPDASDAAVVAIRSASQV